MSGRCTVEVGTMTDIILLANVVEGSGFRGKFLKIQFSTGGAWVLSWRRPGAISQRSSEVTGMCC